MESVEVAIVGAGQAGLATSWHLKRAGIEHLVLEAGRVAETWRSRRWDSFCLVTPNWTMQLPGGAYTGPDPDGFMPKGELVDHIQRWSDGFAAPVRERTPVTALEADGDRFTLDTTTGTVGARCVVVASGGYQRAHRPAGAEQIPASVDQLLADEYSCPEALEPGAVLVVGSGQTGCQLAEELHATGRTVFLSCGRAPWAPRRIAGRDLVWWFIHTGWWARTPAELPSPAARLLSNPQLSGHDGGHDLNYRTLHEKGVQLLGRYLGVEGGAAHFADDLAASVDAGDALTLRYKQRIDAACVERGLASTWDMPPPFRASSRTELGLARERVTTVIWTAGYRPDYGWVRFPIFDGMGFPVQVDGRTSVPGLYFTGLNFGRKAQSATLYGAGEDAEAVVADIVERRRR